MSTPPFKFWETVRLIKTGSEVVIWGMEPSENCRKTSYNKPGWSYHIRFKDGQEATFHQEDLERI